MRTIDSLLPEMLDQFMLRMGTENPAVLGVSTGFEDLDALLGGLPRGSLILLASKPGIGKSLLATSIAGRIALADHLPVCILTYEMSAHSVVTRMMAAMGDIDLSRLQAGELKDPEWPRLTEMMDRLNEAPIWIEEANGQSAADACASVRDIWAGKHGLGLVVVDYLQRVRLDTDPGIAGETAAGKALCEFKHLAWQLNCPVLVLSELAPLHWKSYGNRRPHLSDLPIGIEHYADIVLLLHTEGVGDPSFSEGAITEVNVARNRNGKLGTMQLVIAAGSMRFDKLPASLREPDGSYGPTTEAPPPRDHQPPAGTEVAVPPSSEAQPNWAQLYPLLFVAPSTRVNVGPGWYAPLHVLFGKLMKLRKATMRRAEVLPQIFSVRSKLGRLFVSYSDPDDDFRQAYREAAAACARRCEICGGDGTLLWTLNWPRVRCAQHENTHG